MANQVTIGPASYQVLLVEDSPGDAALVRHSLEVLEDESPGSFNLIHVERLDDALAELLARTFDLVVLDLSLPDSFGIESFARMSEAAKGVPVVVLTDVEDEELGSRLVQMGAQDHVVKWQIAGRVLVRCLRCAIDSRGIERELKRAREMALQAARSKIEFRTAMSHEIRTPLDSILGMADLLSETNLSAEQGRFVESFRVAGEALLDLVNGILDHSKIEAGRLDLDEIEFDVAQLLETTMETLAVPAHKKRLALAYEIDPSLDTSVFGDPARLRQVLVNLVGNAIKFTERGEILVSVTPEPGADAGTLRFCIRDTGVGIPKGELSKVFEAHPQSDGTIARRYGETGVGLRLCVGLVQLMSGRIWVESEVGCGSTFSFTVKLRPDVSKAGVSKPAPIVIDGRALVAGGNATERRVLNDLLSVRGYVVCEAETGDGAIEEIRRSERERRPFDVVLIDCRMQVDGGFSVLEAVAEVPRLLGRTSMMLTSDHRIGDVTRCESLGLAGWLMKPVKISKLIELLRRIVASEVESRQPRSEVSSQGETSQAEMRPRRILVVDDSADNRSLIQTYLHSTNHQLVMAENGKAAIDAYRNDVFDLILMDMQMPVVDGYSATRMIRAIEGDTESRVPIVALTAYAFKEERQRSFEAGCDAHLTKPIPRKDLLAAIDKYGKCTTIVVEVDEEVRALVDGFLANRHADVKRLMNAVEIGDFETIRMIGHSMKDTGRNYGFDGITDIGALLEVAGEETEMMNAQRQIAELIDYLDRVESRSEQRPAEGEVERG